MTWRRAVRTAVPMTDEGAEKSVDPAVADGTAASAMSPANETVEPRVPATMPHLSAMIRMEHWLPLLVALATGLLMVAAFFVALHLLSLIHHTVLLVALAGLVAYALDPIVEWVRGTYRPPGARRYPRWLGVLTVFVILFAAWGLGTFFLGKEAANQIGYLAVNRTEIANSARARVDEWDAELADHNIPIHLGQLVDHPPADVAGFGQKVARGSLSVLSDASRTVVEGIIVLLIAVYLLIYSEELSAAALRGMPPRVRPYAAQWRDDVNRILGGFVRGQAVLALLLGAGAAAACGILGLRLWLLIGFFVVVCSLLPVIGPYIGALPAIASAILTPPHGFLNPLTRTICVVVLFFLINEGGSKVLYPRLVGRALGLHEMVVLLALLAGLELGGIAGVLFAAPLTALAIVTAIQLWRLWHGVPPTSVATAAREEGEEMVAEGTP